MILLDTNVLSEAMRPASEPRVTAWLREQSRRDSTYVSAITLTELERGVAELAPGSRRSGLIDWLNETRAEFAERFIPVDVRIAELCGVRQGEMRRRGVSVSLADGLIAASARAYGLRVATRNIRHILDAGAAVYDPWTGQAHEPEL